MTATTEIAAGCAIGTDLEDGSIGSRSGSAQLDPRSA